MTDNEQVRGGRGLGVGVGSGIVLLSALLLVVAYPPLVAGVEPLFGVGNLFFPLGVSLVALLLAIGGGVAVGKSVADTTDVRATRVLASVIVPVTIVSLIGSYLVVVAGFAPTAPFIIGAVVLAALVGGLLGGRGSV